ncbi:MAG: LysE family translocator [Campylobacteraceae bacterium]|nr:LysE family translocator [Campylobacteraceae bacterium]
MDLHNYLNYVLIAFFTITSPGAAILLAINTAMSFDLRAVFFSTIGNILGLFILSSVAMFGVGVLLKTSAVFFMALKIIGALYLVYLGIMQFSNKHIKLHLTKNTNHKSYSLKKVFKKGFLVAITNPKPILFFSAIFPLFMDKKSSITLQFFIMTTTFMFISFCSLMFYGYISKRAKAWFFDEHKLKVFYKISGLLFILMGIGLVFV